MEIFQKFHKNFGKFQKNGYQQSETDKFVFTKFTKTMQVERTKRRKIDKITKTGDLILCDQC